MPDIRELREQRNQAATRIQELANRINTERREFAADERQNWDAANADFDRLGREIEIQERASQVQFVVNQRSNDNGVGREDRNATTEQTERRTSEQIEQQRTVAMRAWLRHQSGLELSEEEVETCRDLRLNLTSRELVIDLWPDSHIRNVQQRLRGTEGEARAAILQRESRANLSAQTGTSGGYFRAPGTLTSMFEINMLAFGGVRQVADIITTQTGEPLLLPTVNDTGNSGALLAENTTMGSGVNPSFALKRFDAYKFSSTPVLIPTELLEDAQYDIAGYIGQALGERIGRASAVYYATGTGASQPEGIVTGSTLGVTTASGTAIKFDELVQLVHSVDPAYRNMPGVGWLMHDQVMSYIRQIKDGTGRPLWISGENYNAGVREGQPATLLGYAINICQEMASSVATTNKTALFGLLPKYKIRRVRDVRMYRLVERYRDLDQDGFVAFVREDGRMIDAGTAPIKHLLQA